MFLLLIKILLSPSFFEPLYYALWWGLIHFNYLIIKSFGRNCYSPEVRLKDKSRPSHGRIVLRGRETPELVDDRQDGKTTLTVDADKDLLDKINGLLKEKNRLDVRKLCAYMIWDEGFSISVIGLPILNLFHLEAMKTNHCLQLKYKFM